MTSEAPPTTRADRNALRFVLMLVATCVALMASHALVGGGCLDDPSARATHRFAITYEVIVHALLGITCRITYMVGSRAQGDGINFTQMTTVWLSTAMFGGGMVLALVFMMRALSLNINGADIGLGTAELETTASMAFVLGFFNETPRRLFSLIRKTVRPADGD